MRGMITDASKCSKCGRSMPTSSRRALPVPRFTIRDVLLLTLAVGLALGWWAERCSLAAARDTAIADRNTAIADASKFSIYYFGRGKHLLDDTNERKWLDALVRKYHPKQAAARWDYIPE